MQKGALCSGVKKMNCSFTPDGSSFVPRTAHAPAGLRKSHLDFLNHISQRIGFHFFFHSLLHFHQFSI